MITMDDKDLRRMERDLKTFASRAYPFASRNTINGAAFGTQKVARDIVKGKMIERNAFTRQSIRVEQAKTLNVSQQAATVGSTADYMEDQEFGAVRLKRGKHGVPIATSEASNEGPKVIPRRKLPTKANKLQNIQLRNKRTKGKTRAQRNRIAVAEAAAGKGRKFVFLDLGRRSGIFKVTGGKRRPKLKKMYDLSRASVVIPPRPWLGPAVRKIEPTIPRLYRKSLEFQLRRHGLFDGR